jgi:hypothetical protein
VARIRHHLAKLRPWHGVVVAIALVTIAGMVSLAMGVRSAPRPHGFSQASSP